MCSSELFRIFRIPGYYVSREDVLMAIRNEHSAEKEIRDVALAAMDFIESGNGLVELREVVDCFIEVEAVIASSKRQAFVHLMECIFTSKGISIIATPSDTKN